MSSIDLTINIKEFEEEKQQAKKLANERFSSEKPNQNYHWEDLGLDYIEEELEGNDLKISGTMKTDSGKEIGYVHLHVPLDLDMLIEIFQSYIKKLNKVKTVMESVKDE